MIVLTEEGQVYSWGSNNSKQICYAIESLLVTVPFMIFDKHVKIVQIAAGCYHSW